VNGIRIVKMSGSGNDFIMLGPEEAHTLGRRLAKWVRAVCRRHLSIGADGVLVVEPMDGIRVNVRFHNPDGTEAFCGNGMRCAAKFAFTNGHALKNMTLATCIGDVPADIQGDCVKLVLPVPVDRGHVSVETEAGELAGRRIDAGVPHFVVFVPDVADVPMDEWGPLARHHPAFAPQGVNLNVVSINRSNLLEVRTWERGVEGETLACGTGAVAAAAAVSIEHGGRSFDILPRSGIPITVTYHGPEDRPEFVIMRGDARLVFEGRLGPHALSGITKRDDFLCSGDR